MRHAAAIVRRSRKESRLEARVTPEKKRLIARVAAHRNSDSVSTRQADRHVRGHDSV